MLGFIWKRVHNSRQREEKKIFIGSRFLCIKKDDFLIFFFCTFFLFYFIYFIENG